MTELKIRQSIIMMVLKYKMGKLLVLMASVVADQPLARKEMKGIHLSGLCHRLKRGQNHPDKGYYHPQRNQNQKGMYPDGLFYFVFFHTNLLNCSEPIFSGPSSAEQ